MTQNPTELPELFLGFYPCKECNYTAPPELRKTERKHFDAHAYECTRCLWKPETKATEPEARAAYNTRSPEKAAPDVEALKREILTDYNNDTEVNSGNSILISFVIDHLAKRGYLAKGYGPNKPDRTPEPNS